jgi:hypothetical protein
MAKIFSVRSSSTVALHKRKKELLSGLTIPKEAVRASYVQQYLTCGKKNCRCRRGHKHGPFYYLVQSLEVGAVRKFLLKTAPQRQEARAAITAYSQFQKNFEELSQINTELLRREECA